METLPFRIENDGTRGIVEIVLVSIVEIVVIEEEVLLDSCVGEVPICSSDLLGRSSAFDATIGAVVLVKLDRTKSRSKRRKQRSN